MKALLLVALAFIGAALLAVLLPHLAAPLLVVRIVLIVSMSLPS